MRVKHLIELLKSCDPEAYVVINDEPSIDEDNNLDEGRTTDVVCLEEGYTDDELINSDKTFSLHPVNGYLVPGVRLVGYGHSITNVGRLNINGIESDLSVTPAEPKWGDRWEELIGEQMKRAR